MTVISTFKPAYPKLTALPASILALVRHSYPVGKVHRAVPLPGGGWNSIFRLETGSGSFIIRLSYRDADERQLMFEAQLIEVMAKRFFCVPQILCAQAEKVYCTWQGRAVSLFQTSVGAPCARTKAMRNECATLLGQLHAEGLRHSFREDREGYPRLSKLDWNNNRMWQWERIRSLFAGDREWVFRMFERPEGTVSEVKQILASSQVIIDMAERAREWIEGISTNTSLPIGAIHGDFAPRNLLTNAKSISGVVDWDDCQVEWLAWDLAKAAWEFCREKEMYSLDSRKLIGFWETYETSLGQQAVSSFSELVQFVWCVRCIEILYGLGDALNGDRWYPRYLLANLEAASRLIEFKA